MKPAGAAKSYLANQEKADTAKLSQRNKDFEISTVHERVAGVEEKVQNEAAYERYKAKQAASEPERVGSVQGHAEQGGNGQSSQDTAPVPEAVSEEERDLEEVNLSEKPKRTEAPAKEIASISVSLQLWMLAAVP